MKKKKKNRGEDKPIHFFIFLVFVIFFYTAKITPSALYSPISKLIGHIMYYSMRKNRKLVLKNIDIVYGDTIDFKRKNDLGRDLFSGIVLSLFECIQLTKVTDQQFLQRTIYEGEENLREALSRNKGVVGISPHMGNFPRLQLALIKKGYPATYFSRPPSGRYLARFFKEFIASVHVPLIYTTNKRQAIIDAYKWLKHKGMLCFYIDQQDNKGVEVDFFGKRVFAPAGAASFARKSGASVVGLFTYRMADGRHKIIIEGPYELQKTDDEREDIKTNTAIFLKRIEYYVSLYPEHWYSWLHKRFPKLY